ncbi:hypothetical protein M0805_002765 [Coniferiporia weirii]|nr:hypothetical protein M0805_002765 [Coniferiporia weirii]
MSTATPADSDSERLLVQIASYNTNLQGNAGLPQDLVDWLAPTLKVSSFLSHARRAPDIVAVGFQELLPLHLGLSGLSGRVVETRDTLIRTQIEAHAPDKSRYVLVARVVNAGVALLVYARDERVAARVCDVQTQWTGCGPGWMGNKGAVGVRFRLAGSGPGQGRGENAGGEVFTFVNAHLTANAGKLERRIADYHHIVGTLLFPPPPSSPSSSGAHTHTTLYATSHLFFLGDLNFRLAIPPDHAFGGSAGAGAGRGAAVYDALGDDAHREELKEFDELLRERRAGRVFVGLREAEFWRFKCTYKYRLQEVDRYNPARMPAWTDRVMYASHADAPDAPEGSTIEPVLYTSIPSYIASDHKPIVALLLVPTTVFSPPSPASASPSSSAQPIPAPTPPPTLHLPPTYTPTPDPYWIPKRIAGRALDRLVGAVWTLLVFVGLGSAGVGVVGLVVIGVAARWFGFGSGFGFGLGGYRFGGGGGGGEGGDGARAGAGAVRLEE